MTEHQDKPASEVGGWATPLKTARLVLADGTVLEGFGLGATGEAVGEVCFNTAMTGYEEILTDPSYTGQIVTFTFPHIGNVGTNEDDIETSNLGGDCRVRASSSMRRSPTRRTTAPPAISTNGCKARGIIGLYRHRYPRAHRLYPRQGHAQRRDRARAGRQLRHRRAEGQGRAPGRALSAWTWCRTSPARQRAEWDETSWMPEHGYGRRRNDEFHVVAIDYGVKRNILRLLADLGCKVTIVPATTSADEIRRAQPGRRVPLERPGRSRRDRRICGARDPRSDRPQDPDLRHLPWPSDAGIASARRP